jgi:hypothetical protein
VRWAWCGLTLLIASLLLMSLSHSHISRIEIVLEGVSLVLLAATNLLYDIKRR